MKDRYCKKRIADSVTSMKLKSLHNRPRNKDNRPDVYLVQQRVWGQLELAGHEEPMWIQRPDGWLLLDLPR